jgi:outer membrane protein TolC
MVALTISNNLNFKKASYQLNNAELDARQLDADNLMTQSEVLDRQKELNILQQQNTFQNQKEQLIIQAVDNYFKLALAEKDIARKEKNIELQRAVFQEVEVQVAAGYRIELDLLQQGNTYYDALFSCEKAKLDYQQLLIELRNDLGLSKDTEIIATSVTMTQLPEIDSSVSFSKARKNSFNLKSKEIEIELARLRLKKAEIDQEPQLEIEKLANNLEIGTLEQLIIEQDLDYQISTQLQNYKESKNGILLSEQSLRQMEENESIIKQQVQAGLRTEDELLSATIGVLDAEYRLISSVRQYYQTFLELQKMMGILDEGEIGQ